MFHPQEFKKEVVQYLLQHGIKQTLEKYNKIPKSTIYYWVYKINQENNLNKNNSFYYSKTRIDPRIIVFIKKIRVLFPTITRKKIKQLCDQYSYINNTSYISISSVGRILKRIVEGEE